MILPTFTTAIQPRNSRHQQEQHLMVVQLVSLHKVAPQLQPLQLNQLRVWARLHLAPHTLHDQATHPSRNLISETDLPMSHPLHNLETVHNHLPSIDLHLPPGRTRYKFALTVNPHTRILYRDLPGRLLSNSRIGGLDPMLFLRRRLLHSSHQDLHR